MQGNFRKTSTSASLTTTKDFDCVDHNRLWKILKEMEIPDHLTCLLQNLCAGQEATEPDVEQWIGSKLGKQYIKAVYCQPAYLLYRQSCCYSVTKLCLTLQPHELQHARPSCPSLSHKACPSSRPLNQ